MTRLNQPELAKLRPRLTVIGVGGAGCNAVNNMIAAGLVGVEFVVANTDAQTLAASSAERRLQLGVKLTEGLGSGSKPEIGEAAAEEAIEDIRAEIDGSHMLFIAAGMGGGTGTGAAGVIARIARELGILTVGVVTKPFYFEGTRRMRIADAGIAELRRYVDTLIVIPNQNLFRVANERTTFAEAFVLADQVLYSGVACVVDLIVKEGMINLDFADVRAVLSGMGTAMMGTGEAAGERRAIAAAEEAISNPLVDEVSLKGAKGLLLSITGGSDLKLYEVDEAATRVRQEVDPDANIIVGATFDDALGDRVRVSIVASGMARLADGSLAPPAHTANPAANAQMGHAHSGPAQAPAWRPAHAAPHAPHSAPHADNPERMPSPHWRPDEARGSAHHDARGEWVPVAPHPTESTAASHGAAAPGQGRLEPVVPSSETARHGRRSTWQAPGDVVIEEGLPPPSALPVTGSSDSDTRSPAHAAGDFRPLPPNEIRRSPNGRRMPEVEDFPIVGQREFRAKGGAGAQGSPDNAALGGQGRRRGGLFDRLMGRSSGGKSTGPGDSQQAGNFIDPRSGFGGVGGRPGEGAENSSTATSGNLDRGSHGSGKDVGSYGYYARDRK